MYMKYLIMNLSCEYNGNTSIGLQLSLLKIIIFYIFYIIWSSSLSFKYLN